MLPSIEPDFFSYAINNPIYFQDPNGTQVEGILGGIAGIVGPVVGIVTGIAAGVIVAIEIIEHNKKCPICEEKFDECLDNPWQPEWNQADFGKKKDCPSCYRECKNKGGIWPEYKCPSPFTPPPGPLFL